jgi:hypothetical protein
MKLLVMQFSENTELILFGTKREMKQQEAGGNYIMRFFII